MALIDKTDKDKERRKEKKGAKITKKVISAAVRHEWRHGDGDGDDQH